MNNTNNLSQNAFRDVVPRITLHTGKKIPVMGLNYLDASTVHVGEAIHVVRNAIDTGIRYINVKANHEEEIGTAINTKIVEGVVKREDLFIAFKPDHEDIIRRHVKVRCQYSLNKMNLVNFDLILLTRPHKDYSSYIREIWTDMEDLVTMGITFSIGVADFSEKTLQRICNKCKILPAVHEMEIHLNNVPFKLINYCTKKHIRMVTRKPFGYVYDGGLCHKVPDQIFYDMRSSTVTDTAIKWGKTPFQIVLKYMIQSHIIPLPREFLGRNMFDHYVQIFRDPDFILDSADMILLRHLNVSAQ